jgi:hypothetical protein
MPNWCWNQLEFYGKEKTIENLHKLFEKTEEMERKTGYGQLLHGIEEALDGYMFNLCIDSPDCDTLTLTFDSRWSPIPQDMIKIADMFNLTFIYKYEEGGMGLYGKYIYDEEGMSEYSLTEEELETFRYKNEDDEEDEQTGIDYEGLWDFIDERL